MQPPPSLPPYIFPWTHSIFHALLRTSSILHAPPPLEPPLSALTTLAGSERRIRTSRAGTKHAINCTDLAAALQDTQVPWLTLGIDDKSGGSMPGCSHLDGDGWPRLLGLQMHAWAAAMGGGGSDDGGGGGSDDGGGAAGDGAAAEAHRYGMFLERSHGFNPWRSSLELEQRLNAQFMAATSGPFFAPEGEATKSVPRRSKAAARRRGAQMPAQGGGEEAPNVGIGRLSACVMHSMLWPRAALRKSLAPLLSRIGDNSVVALQMRTGWAEAAASVEAGMDPLVRELTGAPPHTASSPGSSSLLPPTLEDGRSRGKGKRKGKGKAKAEDKGYARGALSLYARGPLALYAGMAEALAATPEALLRTEAERVETLEAEAVLRGLSTPPGMPRTLAATEELLLTRHRLSCGGGRCLFREGDNATQRTG